MYQDERKLDFKPLGIAIKKAREAKGWTQEYLAQLVDLTPRSIMYIENRGQHPRLNKFYLITTLLDISVDQFFFPCNEDGDNNRRKQVDVNRYGGSPLTVSSSPSTCWSVSESFFWVGFPPFAEIPSHGLYSSNWLRSAE